VLRLDITEIRFGLIEPESLTIAGILYFTGLLDSGMVQAGELSEKTLPGFSKIKTDYKAHYWDAV